MSDETPQLLNQENYSGPTAARTRMDQLGGVFQPDRSSNHRHVFFLASRNVWGSIELQNGTYMVGLWSACPCALG
jgi:hypothetical protein